MSLRAELLRLSLKAMKPRPGRRERPIAAVRRRLRLLEPVVPRPPAGTRTTAITVDGIEAFEIEVPQARPDRCILYFHGGAYVIGNAALFRDFTWRIGAAARARVLFFHYRLAPEHPFPAAIEDASKMHRWLADRIEPARIGFVGDSAGGGLALATAHKLRDEGSSLPGAVVALSPWTDLALTGASLIANADADPVITAALLPTFANRYLAGADPRHPYASPLYGNALGLPPVLIHVGSDEILRDDSVRMAERLREAGCEVEIEVWDRMVHTWHLYARILPEGRNAIARIGAFLDSRV